MEKISTGCPYAFGGLTIRADGSYSPCQRSRLHLTDVDAHGRTLLESFHSTEFEELRRQFQAGEKPKSCERCWKQEEAGQRSLRIKALEEFGEEEPRGLVSLSPALGNRCERACLHCGNRGSSGWTAESSVLARLPGNPFVQSFVGECTPGICWTVDDVKDLRFLILQETEALLQPALIPLFRLLEEAGRLSEIDVQLETAGGVLPGPELRSWLEKIQRLEIALSVDAHGELNTYIRHPTPWSQVEASLEFWQDLARTKPDWKIRCVSTVSVLNVMGLDSLYEWSQARGLGEPILNQVHFPWYLSLDILSDEQRENLARKNTWDKVQRLLRAPRPARSDVPRAALRTGLLHFREFLRRTDSHRGLSFLKAQPELAEYFFASAPRQPSGS